MAVDFKRLQFGFQFRLLMDQNTFLGTEFGFADLLVVPPAYPQKFKNTTPSRIAPQAKPWRRLATSRTPLSITTNPLCKKTQGWREETAGSSEEKFGSGNGKKSIFLALTAGSCATAPNLSNLKVALGSPANSTALGTAERVAPRVPSWCSRTCWLASGGVREATRPTHQTCQG